MLRPFLLVVPIGWIGVNSLLLLGVYLVAMRMIHIYEKRQVAAFAKAVGALEAAHPQAAAYAPGAIL